jgi:hypothetical protein
LSSCFIVLLTYCPFDHNFGYNRPYEGGQG